jgi:xylose isomerase
MDAFALGLRKAAKISSVGKMAAMVAARYSSFDAGVGKAIEDGQASFDSLEEFVLANGEPSARSGRQELYEGLFNAAVMSP